MRADESTSQRAYQLQRLTKWLDGQRKGEHFPIGSWYGIAASLGLGRSDRQRISDARKLGYIFQYDRTAKAYVWKGKEEVFQLELVEA